MGGLNGRRVGRLLLGLIVSLGWLLAGCSGGTESAGPGSSGASVGPTTSPPATSASTSPAASVEPSAPVTPSVSVWDPPGDGALPAAAKLQAAIDGFAGTMGVPGLGAAVVSPQGSWAGAAGVDAAGVKIRPDSAFGIGSVTKTFIAAEILELAANGQIDLDAPVSTYLDLPFDTAGATVRQLATMTSGFPGVSDAALEELIAKDLGRTWTSDDVLELAKDKSRLGTLGGPSAYNGINYHVLGMVIEKVTAEPLDKVLRRAVLDPAGLDRIWMQPGEQPRPPLTVALDGSAKIVDQQSAYLPSLAAASSGRGGAGMAGDAPSLARWGYLLYGGRVIDPSLVATMTSGDPNSGDGYGFGTMLADADGTVLVGHAGDYMGYSSMMLVWPNTRTAIVVLAPKEGVTLDGTLPGWATALYQVLEGA